MFRLVLLRHGQSVWNLANVFTGWTDVDLTAHGEQEAQRAAEVLADRDIGFDRCFTSCLRRAIKTLWIVLEAMDLMWLPTEKHWRLNERHYGSLQGLNKEQTARQYGEDQVFAWRRSYDVLPPALDREDPRFPGFEAKYRGVPAEELPVSESLEMTVSRVLPFWKGHIAPAILRGERALVSAHGNSLRGLVMHLDGLSPEEIPAFEIPTGVPLVYELDHALRPLSRTFLE
jgi:2,3-bisphosphoglycerate-dependent phosphoglycerate mutase